MGARSIEEYASSLSEEQKQIVESLDQLVRSAITEADASIKWSQPVYSTNGPCCFIKAHKQHVAFGFWWGARIDDAFGRLEGSGEKMRHVKIRSIDEIDEEQFITYVKEAARLNAELGDPTKTKA